MKIITAKQRLVDLRAALLQQETSFSRACNGSLDSCERFKSGNFPSSPFVHTRSFSVQPGRESFAGKQSSEKETFPGKKFSISYYRSQLYGHSVFCGHHVEGRKYSTNDKKKNLSFFRYYT